MPSNTITPTPLAPVVNPAVDSLTVVNSFNTLLITLQGLGVLNTTSPQPILSFGPAYFTDSIGDYIISWGNIPPYSWQFFTSTDGGTTWSHIQVYSGGLLDSLPGLPLEKLVTITSGQFSGATLLCVQGFDINGVACTTQSNALAYTPPTGGG